MTHAQRTGERGRLRTAALPMPKGAAALLPLLLAPSPMLVASTILRTPGGGRTNTRRCSAGATSECSGSSWYLRRRMA